MCEKRITIKFNVNHTVDADQDNELEAPESEANDDAIKSKPNFEVDVVRGGTTLSFTCQFLEGQAAEGEYGKNVHLFFTFSFILINLISSFICTDDLFGIQELTIYKGEFNDEVYACSGDILDGYFYDLLMGLLEQKGISNEFGSKLIQLSTDYERSLYINLLNSLKDFVSK